MITGRYFVDYRKRRRGYQIPKVTSKLLDENVPILGVGQQPNKERFDGVGKATA